jgi:drug/metabolite transporter superfamily protein YnfA
MRILSTAGGTLRHGLGAAAEAAVVVAIALALVFGAAVLTRSDPAGAADVYAARGGNGNGNSGNGNSGNGSGGSVVAASVSASPNPAAPGTRVEVTGCGYDTNNSVELRITHPDGSLEAYGVGVWYTGCMNPTPFFVNDPGAYAIEVWQRNSKSAGLMATTSLAVD